MITISDLKKAEIGKAYFSEDGRFFRKFLGFSRSCNLIYYEHYDKEGCDCKRIEEINEENWQLIHIEPPKPKKRYWLWTVSVEGEGIYKSENYMDEDARKTNGRSFLRKSDLFKKHEDEFIDVEVE